MDRCDFTFRGESLSDHGYMLCEFDGSGSVENVTTDSQRELTSISMFGGRYFPIIFSLRRCACSGDVDMQTRK